MVGNSIELDAIFSLGFYSAETFIISAHQDSFLCSFSPRAKNQHDKLPRETENEISSAARGTF